MSKQNVINNGPASGVTAGSYTSTNLTVNAAGIITAASNGSGGSNHTYSNALWVDLVGGNDSSAGTNENAPFLTFAHAVSTAGTTPTTIYIIGDIDCYENVTTSGAGQVLDVQAQGINFGGTITFSYGDTVKFFCRASYSIVNNISSVDTCQVFGGTITYTEQGQGYIVCNGVLTYTNAGSYDSYIIANQVTVTLSSGAYVTILSNDIQGSIATSASMIFVGTLGSSITNDGTGIINGIRGYTGTSTGYGFGNVLQFGNSSELTYTLTNAAPTAANQVLFSSGAGPAASTSWGALPYVGLTWVTSGTTGITATVNHGYVVTSTVLQTITLPSTFAVGAIIAVEGAGTGLWKCAAASGTNIILNPYVGTTAGSLSSASEYDNVQLIGLVANTTWKVQFTNSAGLTIV